MPLYRRRHNISRDDRGREGGIPPDPIYLFFAGVGGWTPDCELCGKNMLYSFFLFLCSQSVRCDCEARTSSQLSPDNICCWPVTATVGGHGKASHVACGFTVSYNPSNFYTVTPVCAVPSFCDCTRTTSFWIRMIAGFEVFLVNGSFKMLRHAVWGRRF